MMRTINSQGHSDDSGDELLTDESKTENQTNEVGSETEDNNVECACMTREEVSSLR